MPEVEAKSEKKTGNERDAFRNMGVSFYLWDLHVYISTWKYKKEKFYEKCWFMAEESRPHLQ